MGENGVLVFPDAGTGRNNSSIDPALLLALGNGGGFQGDIDAWDYHNGQGYTACRNGHLSPLSCRMPEPKCRYTCSLWLSSALW